MLTAVVYLLLTLSVGFNLFRSFVIAGNPPCSFFYQNLSLAYQDCSALSNVTALNLDHKQDSIPKLEANLRDAFESYCRHIPDINACVLARLVSNSCDKSVSEIYLTLTAKSSDFCREDGRLSHELVELLQVSRPLDLATIDKCQPSSFDFSLCQRYSDMTRDEQISAATAEKEYDETDYFLEINMCIYSSVFVGCPADAAILTMLYEIDEWLPPRLGANTTEVLSVLHSRARTFS